MPLTSVQHATIMREYDRIRSDNEHILKDRIKEIESLSPDYDALQKEIGILSKKAALAALEPGANDSSDYKTRIKELDKRQKEILENLCKPADYLDPIYDCPLCHDTGTIKGQRCACFKKKAIELIYNDSNLKNITEGISFDSFDLSLYPEAAQDSTGKSPLSYAGEALSAAKAFARDFDSHHDNILIYGNTGVEKTLLSTCIAGELIKTSHSVVYLTAVELFEKLGEYDDNSPLLECDLLIVDDLGTELANSFTISKLFYCVNERILRQKSTIISTNLSLSDIRNNYTDRIYSRIMNSYMILKLTGEDQRIRKLYS